jgi:putative cell wall-binding protein
VTAPVGAFQRDASTSVVTVNPGDAADSVASAQLALDNSFAIGTTIVLKLDGAGVNPGQTNEGVGFVTAPTITVTGPFTTALGATAGSTSDITPTFTSALGSSSGAATIAGIKDEDTITFTNSSAGTAGDFYSLEIAGETIKVGSAAVNGSVSLEPFNTDGGTSLATAVPVATVSNVKLTSPEVSAAPSSLAVALSPITLTEVTAGAIIPTGAQTFTLTLAGAGTPKFTAGVTPTVTVPSGYTDTAAVTGAANPVYTFTVTGPATPVAATVTISGLTVDLTAGGTGVVTLAVNRTTAPATLAGTLNVIGVLTQLRTGGTDRYATAGQLFLNNPASFTGGAGLAAVLASGANYPDALSANYLAQGLGTRVLLTDPNVLPQPTYQALITAGIKTVYIVGGTSAVSANVANAIAATHVSNNNANAFINVIRVSGSDRYATNNQVDLFNGAVAGVSTAIVAVGSNFADALSVAPVVVAKHYPLVLTNGPSLSASAQSTLVNLGIKNVIIVGGTAAVSAATEASIKALGITIEYRIAGTDRTLTAADIATFETTGTGTAAFPATTAYSALNGLGLNIGQVYIARGDGFADALAAGTVAGGVGTGATVGAILLTGDPNTLGAGIPAYLAGKHASVAALTVLGLTSAVSVATANAAIASIS